MTTRPRGRARDRTAHAARTLRVAGTPAPRGPELPAWRTLYASIVLVGALGAALVLAVPSGPARDAATAVAGIACFVTLAAWLRLNARALARFPRHDSR